MTKPKKNYPAKSNETLIKFMAFCQEYPKMRFWQALSNFVGAKNILVNGKDTYYWEGDRK